MAKDGLISVVLPLYNREKTIERAIRSVLDQTYNNLELIIVDDCSNDKSLDIVSSINDARIRLIKLKKNGGACKARNRGINESKGDYIAFQDSDDEWLPDKLEIQMSMLNGGGTDVNFCAFNRISKKKCVKIPMKDFQIPKQNSDFIKELLRENFISTQTLLAKREVFRKIKFDERLPRFQDWDLAIRISSHFSISYLDKALANVYVQEDSITRNGKKGYAALDILRKKYASFIDGNFEIERAFLYKKCILGYKAGINMRVDAKKYLRGGFNLKVAFVYLWSLASFKSR